MKVNIRGDGTLVYIYSDAARGLMELSTSPSDVQVTRASHVEPSGGPEGVRWHADMGPSSGPVLGPYRTREEALRAEVEWLSSRLGIL